MPLERSGVGIWVSSDCKHSNMYCFRKQSFSLLRSANFCSLLIVCRFFFVQLVNDS